MPIKSAIEEVINNRHLDMDQAERAMNIIMNGEATQAQIGSYMTALRMKGETVDEIAGSAKAMRSHMIKVRVPLQEGKVLVDTCGTGGDGKHTFNISTTAAFVLAGAGVKIAKHGNRAASSQSGSADLLIALGGNLDLTPEQVAQCVDQVGIGFLYAINHHPAMRYAIGPRRELGQRTIFNILGPLTNPAGATHQLIGVYDPELTEPMANVLKALGSTAAMVVYGAGGLDELSTTGVNRVSKLANGEVKTYLLDPQDLGLKRTDISELSGGTPEENARITREVLNGKTLGAPRDIVILNAAAALTLLGHNWQAGLTKAALAIDNRSALKVLESWIKLTGSF